MGDNQNGDANFQNTCDDINPCEDETSRLKITIE